jgi:D-3-phosphoglycerate dehydrogenase
MPIANSGRSRQDLHYDYFSDPRSMAPQVDALEVAAAGGAGTRNLVSAAVIAALPQGAVLVNVARGTVVEEAGLVAALRSGHLGAAGLDVFLHEPTIDPVFSTFPNVVLSPHAASATVETRAAMGDLMLANMEAWLDGRPLLTPVA